MKKSAEFLSDLASQVESGLITLDEAFDIVAGNEKLTDEQQHLVDQAIIDCRNSSSMKVFGSGGDEAYAYPHPSGGIAWGFNSAAHGGFCIAKGIRD
jgi:hypothetical protein